LLLGKSTRTYIRFSHTRGGLYTKTYKGGGIKISAHLLGNLVYVLYLCNMTELEIQALTLFRDYTFLQLKTISVGMEMNSKEAEIVEKALELYRYYTSYKLKNDKIRTTK
jgi:hypothetical protein